MPSDSRPAPLVAPEVDLRAIAPYMQLDVVRLRDSGIAVRASPDAFRAAVLLWCVAWHQVPAASLPDDEHLLARYADVHLLKWRAIREEALRGFVLCSDGRLYHHVIAEKAIEAYTRVHKRRAQTQAATEARRKTPGQSPPRPPTDPHAKGGGYFDDTPQASARGPSLSAPGGRSEVDGKNSHDVSAAPNRNGEVDGNRLRSTDVPIGEERRGEEVREESQNTPTHTPSVAAGARVLSADDIAWGTLSRDIVEVFEKASNPTPIDTNWTNIWREAGYPPRICLAVVRAGTTNARPSSLKYFDKPIAEEVAKITKAKAIGAGTPAAATIDWDRAMAIYANTDGQVWIAAGFPKPGFGGCPVPAELLHKHMPDKFPAPRSPPPPQTH